MFWRTGFGRRLETTVSPELTVASPLAGHQREPGQRDETTVESPASHRNSSKIESITDWFAQRRRVAHHVSMVPVRAGVERQTRGWNVRRAAQLTALVSVFAVAAAAVLGVVLPAAGAAGPALVVVAGVLGMPHGAVDHLAMGWSRGGRGPADGPLGGASPVMLVGYAVLAVGVAWAALVFTVPVVLGLLVLSGVHFAEGEIAFDRLRGGVGSVLTGAALGTAIIAGPVLLRPDAVRPVLDALDPGLAPVLAVLRIPVLLLTGALVVAGAASAIRRRSWPAVGELTVVVLAGLLAPPLLVFAVWFGAWHAPRHLVRLLELEGSGDTRERMLRLARAAVLPTGAALAGLVVLVAISGSVPAAVLVVLLALTVPHAAVVARMGRVRRDLQARGPQHTPSTTGSRQAPS